MREILFRGQTRRYGEKVRMGDGAKVPSHWVYGGVLQGIGDHSIIYGGGNADDPSEGLSKHCVYTDTIGMFTGITDKNGKKVFEGDIIRTDNGRASAVSVVKYGNFRPKMIYKMFWNYTGQTPKQDLHGVYCESSKEQMMLFDSPTCIEVIGNIHDNPELLTEK